MLLKMFIIGFETEKKKKETSCAQPSSPPTPGPRAPHLPFLPFL
jgi:hypothetical protein